MGKSLLKPSIQNEIGLTLIEVLIALAILSIALTTIIKLTSQNIVHTQYLQNKTIAAWVASDVMNTVRIEKIKLPMAPDHIEKQTSMLGQSWLWQAHLSKTPNPRIKKIYVTVYQLPQKKKLIRLESYLYVNPSQ